MPIGFNQGVFYRIRSGHEEMLQPTMLQHFLDAGADAIELSSNPLTQLDELLALPADFFASFSYISLHAPSFPYGNDEKTTVLLEKLVQLTTKFNLQNIVLHPDWVKDWEVFLQFPALPLSIENMDNNKQFGYTVAHLAPIVEKYNLNVTIDIQHAYTRDPSMKLADELQDCFAEKIVEYHVSGYQQPMLHYGLFHTQQDIIIEHIKYRDKPMIIESTFDTYADPVKEMAYITEKLA